MKLTEGFNWIIRSYAKAWRGFNDWIDTRKESLGPERLALVSLFDTFAIIVKIVAIFSTMLMVIGVIAGYCYIFVGVAHLTNDLVSVILFVFSTFFLYAYIDNEEKLHIKQKELP